MKSSSPNEIRFTFAESLSTIAVTHDITCASVNHLTRLVRKNIPNRCTFSVFKRRSLNLIGTGRSAPYKFLSKAHLFLLPARVQESAAAKRTMQLRCYNVSAVTFYPSSHHTYPMPMVILLDSTHRSMYKNRLRSLGSAAGITHCGIISANTY